MDYDLLSSGCLRSEMSTFMTVKPERVRGDWYDMSERGAE